MTELLPVLLACGAGCLLGMLGRYLALKSLKEKQQTFAWIRLAVNTACCFVIGLFAGQFDKVIESDALQFSFFLTIGLLAGFNPPYQGARDVRHLVREGRFEAAILSAAGSLVLYVFAGIAGFMLAVSL